MLIGYSNKEVEKLCNNPRYAKKELGEKIMVKLYQRMEWLGAADNLSIFNDTYKFLRLHKLTGNYEGSYAIDIDKKYRIVFYPCNENGDYNDSDFKLISVVNIEEVSNHYDD